MSTERQDLTPGYNVQRRGFHGHKPVVVIFVYEDGRAKIRYSAMTEAACRRWITKQGR